MENNKTKYNEKVLDWEELKNIGVTKEELEKNGDLIPLLNGEETKPIFVYVPILGQPKEMQVTLQIQEENDKVVLQLTCVKCSDPNIDSDIE